MFTNVVVISGRAASDLEIKTSQGGTKYALISLAYNKPKRVSDGWDYETHFFDVSLVGDILNGEAGSIVKGQIVTVTGTLEQKKWTDKNTGESRTKIGIRAYQVQAYKCEKKVEKKTDFEDDIPF